MTRKALLQDVELFSFKLGENRGMLRSKGEEAKNAEDLGSNKGLRHFTFRGLMLWGNKNTAGCIVWKWQEIFLTWLYPY